MIEFFQAHPNLLLFGAFVVGVPLAMFLEWLVQPAPPADWDW